MTACQRSMEHARALGYDPWKVDRFLAHAPPKGVTVDLFNLADIEAIAPDHTLYIQATTIGELQDHIGKAVSVDLPILKGDRRPPRSALNELIACPARVFEIWSWGQEGRRKRWTVTRMRAFARGHGFVWVPVTEGEGGVPYSQETAMDGEVQTSAHGGR